MTVTLAEAKAHLEYEADDRDDHITSLIAASRAWIEGYTSWAMEAGTRSRPFTAFGDYLELPMRPFDALSSIAYVDVDGVGATVTGARYREGRVFPPVAGWPGIEEYSTITATYTVTAADDDTLAQLEQAQLLLIGHWFANREAVDDSRMEAVPFAVEALCGHYHTPTLA